MTTARTTTRTARPRPAGEQDHRRLATAARARLPELVRAAVGAITGGVGPVDAPAVTAVEAAVLAGIDAVFADAPTPAAARAVLKGVGAQERRAGRGLERVESAARLASRAVWRRLTAIAGELRVPPVVMVSTVDALFAFTDDLVDAAREGHDSVTEPSDPRRAELLALLVTPGPVSDLERRAADARWPLPERVVAVVSDLPFRVEPGELDPRILANTDRETTCLLVPADVELPQELAQELARGRDTRFAAGLPMPVAEAHRSVEYGRRLLDLVERGSLPPARLTRGCDHLVTLLTAADGGLLRWIREDNLGPLAQLSEGRRAKLLTTLALWLRHDGDAREVAKRVQLHPQSVRYRVQQVKDLLGDQALEGEKRFLLQLALCTRTRGR
ncbi:PucR family transcriptional regulator [Actinokineospora bangkokensis]|uniref:Uncharacterized protein n=1 Tax=Actinokineospora bangkokensis TaxID=1193682 RepID=A0A1Q9LQM7_9PSEU|nr:helix-turn-helix domain-containing protein [Actinokineospora bangkokensis]OLR94322.1 hypothetical protein BJP25_11170 [Actinokineospora bangkokensis]